MTDYSITLPSYSIGEQVYKQIPTVCAPFGATAVVIGGHKAMAAVRERLLAAIQGSAVTITDLVWYGGEASRENIAALAENPAVAAADMIFAVGGGNLWVVVLDYIAVVGDLNLEFVHGVYPHCR